MQTLSKASFFFGSATVVVPILIGGTVLFILGCALAGSALLGLGILNERNYA